MNRYAQKQAVSALRDGKAIKRRDRAISTARQVKSYKPLPVELHRGGFNYKQIACEGDAAIYEQRWRGSDNVCYEVIHIRRHDGKYIAGQWLEPSEFYPSSSEWGVHGFTLTNKDTAFATLKELQGANGT
jgi:hypothetical protein